VPKSRKVETPASQVAGFIARFDPAIAKLTRAARAKVRKRLPTAVELVYDNYNALAIGFGPTERTSEAILSVAAYATASRCTSRAVRRCPTRTADSRARGIRGDSCG
jgi:hypothetical protein